MLKFFVVFFENSTFFPKRGKKWKKTVLSWLVVLGCFRFQMRLDYILDLSYDLW